MDTLVSVWRAVDPSLPENGCMYVIPGSHARGKRGFSDYESADTKTAVFDTEIVPHQRNVACAVPCILQPNQEQRARWPASITAILESLQRSSMHIASRCGKEGTEGV
jgi:hypothetical protein